MDPVEEKKDEQAIEPENNAEEATSELDELDSILGGNEADSDDDSTEAAADTPADEPKETPTEEPAEAPAEKPTETPSSEPTETPQVDDSLLERAVKAGIPMNMARYSKPEELEKYVESLENSKETPSEDPEPEAEPYKHGLDPEKYDEGVIAEFDKVGKLVNSLQGELKSLREENSALKGQVETTVQSSQQEAAERGLKMFDDDIAGLGDEFKDAVGEGSFTGLEKSNPKAHQNRMEILGNLTTLKQAMPNSDHGKLFNMAVFNVTGKMPGTKAPSADPKPDPTPDKLKETAGKTVGNPGAGKTQNNTKGELNQLTRELDEVLG
jgi:hypothetical protein